jgi:hypothetical protein
LLHTGPSFDSADSGQPDCLLNPDLVDGGGGQFVDDAGPDTRVAE